MILSRGVENGYFSGKRKRVGFGRIRYQESSESSRG